MVWQPGRSTKTTTPNGCGWTARKRIIDTAAVSNRKFDGLVGFRKSPPQGTLSTERCNFTRPKKERRWHLLNSGDTADEFLQDLQVIVDSKKNCGLNLNFGKWARLYSWVELIRSDARQKTERGTRIVSYVLWQLTN